MIGTGTKHSSDDQYSSSLGWSSEEILHLADGEVRHAVDEIVEAGHRSRALALETVERDPGGFWIEVTGAGADCSVSGEVASFLGVVTMRFLLRSVERAGSADSVGTAILPPRLCGGDQIRPTSQKLAGVTPTDAFAPRMPPPLGTLQTLALGERLLQIRKTKHPRAGRYGRRRFLRFPDSPARAADGSGP